MPADVTQPGDLERLVSTTLERLGRIDILVNNAGTSDARAFETVDDAAWQADLELKLFAAIRGARLCVPPMRQAGGGRIVNILNTGAKAPAARSVPDVGQPGRRARAHEGPLEGAGAGRHPRQRGPDRAREERPVGAALGGRGPAGDARGLLRAAGPGARRARRPRGRGRRARRPRRLPGLGAGRLHHRRRRSTSTAATPRWCRSCAAGLRGRLAGSSRLAKSVAAGALALLIVILALDLAVLRRDGLSGFRR